MSERVFYQERDDDSVSPRSLLAKARVSDMQTDEERQLLREYKFILKELEADQEKLGEIRRLLHLYKIFPAKKEDAIVDHRKREVTAAILLRRINENNDKLFALEDTSVLKKVIEMERAKAYTRFIQEGQELLDEERARKEKEYAELLQQHQASRQAAEKKYEAQRKEVKGDTALDNVKRILLSIVFSALGLVEFYLICAIGVLIVALAFGVISYIPILGAIVSWIFRIGENNPDMFAILVSVYLAYFGTMATGEHIIKDKQTLQLALLLMGILLAALNAIFLIVNVLCGDAILANIIIGIAGIAIFIKGKNE